MAPDGAVADSVTLEGSDSAGPVVSRIVTANEPVARLPLRSLAEQLTVVVPMAKVLPDAGEHDTGREPSTASVAVAV